MKRPTQLAELLKNIRRQRGIGQRGMAKAVGVPASSWARYETGERWPSLQALNGLKRMLHIPVNRPLTGGDTPLENNPEDLSDEEQSYLHRKWSIELCELKRKIARKKRELQQAIGRLTVQAEELHAIDLKLKPAQDVLRVLQEKGAGSKSIGIQQATVDELLKKRHWAIISPAFLSKVELQLLKGEIEVMELRREWLEGK